jgi:hypothetical protein
MAESIAARIEREVASWPEVTVHVRVGLMSILLVLSTLPVFAQGTAVPSKGPVNSFEDLWTKVKSGDTVYVLDANARETTGTFERVSATSMLLMIDGQIREIPLSDIRQIARRGDSLWNGALIGATFGGVVGAVASANLHGENQCSDPNCVTGGERVAVALVSAGVYGAIGAGIDALIHGRTVVYRATTQRTVGLVPLLSGHGVGARLSVRF